MEIPNDYIPVVVTIVGACLTAFASILAIVIGKSLDHKRELSYKNRADKYKLYNEFVNHIFDTYFCNDSIKKNISARKEVEKLFDFNKKIILWGSDLVLKNYSNFMYHIRGEINIKKALVQFENLIKAMRKDLGCGGMLLKKGTISRLHINDYDQQGII